MNVRFASGLLLSCLGVACGAAGGSGFAEMSADLPVPDLADVSAEAEREAPPLPETFADLGGNAFVGANVPFGMITWGPNSPQGYSLTNLSGAEMDERWQHYVPIRPSAAALDAAVAETVDRANAGGPGLFRGAAGGADGPIEVELTATERTGFGRFTFPAGADASVLFYATSVQQDDAYRVSGLHVRLGGFTVYFVAEFDAPMAATADFPDGVAARFGRLAGPTLQVKVAMSYVSVDNARANLAAESPGWDFDVVRAAARQAWDDALSRVQVYGGTDLERQRFYTYLYQAFQQPGLASDADGRYLGFDDQVHTVAAGHPHYSSYSIWDTYRGEVQLLAWLFPARVGDLVQSLVDDATQDGANGGGGVMPRWVVANRESGVMETGSATPFVASAHAFGATGFDTAAAWTAMERVETLDGLKNQFVVEHYRLGDFLALGYVPYYDDYQGKQCASFTLEYCLGDFALAQFAKSLGKADAHDRFLALSHQWTNLFNDASGYVQPRMPDGTWRAGFLPAVGHFQGFVEGSPAQYTWMIPHDWDALFARMGGNDAVVARLDHYFTRLNDAYNQWDTEYHCAGNEPGFFTPWAYAAANAPAKTQAVVRRILADVFDVKMPGADDLGAMSAWYVWASLGLYPVLPGTDVLALHGPRFPKVVVQHADGARTLTLTGAGAAVDAPYVQSLEVNGVPYADHRIALGEVTSVNPSTLAFVLGTAPSTWAVAP